MSREKTSRQNGSQKKAVNNTVFRFSSSASGPGEDPRDCEMDSEDFSTSKLYKDLRPILVCMRIFGMYFKRVQIGTKVTTERHVIWCYIFFAIMILNVIRSLSVYTASDGDFNHVLFQKILFTIWSTECAVKVLVLLYYCHRQYGIPLFFRKFKAICNNSGLDKFSGILMKKLIFLSFTFIIFNSVVFTLVLIYVPKLEQIFIEVSWRDALNYEDTLTFKVLLGILAILNSTSSMFPMTFYVVILFSVGKQFKKYNKRFSSAILDDGTFDGDLEEYRLRHQKLCSLVNNLDRIFKNMIAAIYSANIPMFCLVMYTLIATINIHISLILINLFWLSFILLQMGIISLVAAWVNAQAHGPIDSIYTIRSAQGTSDMPLQLTLFLSRLTGTQVGLTALRLFVIDRPTILTVVGMMITYFVLLVQFKLPVTVTSNCNCSIAGTISMDNTTFKIV